MPGLMAVALILISINFAWDYLRSRDKQQVSGPTSASPAPSPAANLGFTLSGQTAAVYRAFYRTGSENDTGGGTAWLIDDKCGIFVTNAHVAEDFDLEGYELLLQQPQTAQTLKVTARALHPARTALLELYDQYGPVGLNATSDITGFVPSMPLDVALLSVAEKATAECKLPDGVKLPKPIALAPDVPGPALAPGTPAAIVHYPGTGNASVAYPSLEATPRVEFGTLRAAGSSLPVPYDVRVKTPLFEDNLFFSMQTTGGSSGGVILGPDGAAIGLSFAATADDDRGLAYQEAIALPVRVVAETMPAGPETLVAAYVQQAKTRFQAYLSSHDYLERVAANRVRSFAGNIGAAATLGLVQRETIVQSGFGKSFCSGATSCILASDTGSPFSKGWFTRHSVSIDSAQINIVAAIDIDLDSEPSSADEKIAKKNDIDTGTGFCPIVLAQLTADADGGLAVTNQTSHEATPMLLIPASHKGQVKIDILVFRPSFCSDTFLTAHMAIVPFSIDMRAPTATSSIEQLMRAAGRSLIGFGRSAAPPLWPSE